MTINNIKPMNKEHAVAGLSYRSAEFVVSIFPIKNIKSRGNNM